MNISKGVGKTKFVFYGFLLLFLFHFESLQIGPVKISHIWKGALLLYLIFALTRKAKIKPYIYGSLLLLSILQIFNIEFINNPFNAILLFGTTLIIPLLGIYFFNLSTDQLKRSLLFFSSFFILCFIPYELGILSSMGEGYGLTSYGFDIVGVVGPFQGVHSASTALAGSLLVVMYFLFCNIYNKFYLFSLFVLGFYFLFSTYVRTGMAMFILGMMPILFHFATKNGKSFIKLLIIGPVVGVIAISWVFSNQALMDRVLGKRLHQSEFSSVEDLGSGRGLIYTAALNTYIDSNPLEMLIGIGQTEQLENMRIRIGKALVPHNGFLLILLNNGIFGIITFIIFLRRVRKVYIESNNEHFVLLKALFFAYITMSFFQDFNMLYTTTLMLISIALVSKSDVVVKDF